MHGPLVGRKTEAWPEARKELRGREAKLDEALDAVSGNPIINVIEEPFPALTNSICHQQLGMAGGGALYQKLGELCGNEFPTADQVYEHTVEEIHNLGIAPLRAKAIHALARDVSAGVREFIDFRTVTEEEVERYFEDEKTRIYGIGDWSTKFFRVYSLEHRDVLLDDDKTLINAMKWTYGLQGSEEEVRTQMREIAEAWKPYRAAAAWFIYKRWEQEGKPKPPK